MSVTRRQWLATVKAEPFPASLRQVKATLLTLADLMTADGELHRWRAQLTEATGLPLRTLDRHLSLGVDVGWLVHEVRGGHGRRAVYRAAIPGSCAPPVADNSRGVVRRPWQTTPTSCPGVVCRPLVDNSSELSATLRQSERPTGRAIASTVSVETADGGASPPEPPGPPRSAAADGSDEKKDQNVFGLFAAPRAERGARGSGGQAAPRPPTAQTAADDTATNDATGARVGGPGGGDDPIARAEAVLRELTAEGAPDDVLATERRRVEWIRALTEATR